MLEKADHCRDCATALHSISARGGAPARDVDVAMCKDLVFGVVNLIVMHVVCH